MKHMSLVILLLSMLFRFLVLKVASWTRLTGYPHAHSITSMLGVHFRHLAPRGMHQKVTAEVALLLYPCPERRKKRYLICT